jgi:hypothetical protein
MGIPNDAPGRRINDWKMPFHQFAESALGVIFHKLIEQFAVIHIDILNGSSHRMADSDKKRCIFRR